MDIEGNKSTLTTLRALYKEDDGARKLLDWASNRQRNVAETTVVYLGWIANINASKAMQLAKRLEEIGCGQLVYGRRGHKTRIRWHFSLISLGKAAKGIGNLEEALLWEESDETPESTAPPSDIIAEVKQKIASSFSVSPEKIEIIIHA